MALSGTLRDFGLAEILQLIGLQRKTAVLNLENGAERVELKFLDGNVVGAAAGAAGGEDRLGQVLVRTGKITETQLAQALEIQGRTLQRVGHILVHNGFISEAELVEALRVQSLQVIFRLFRWRDGTYRVNLVETLDYDDEHFTPISSETILMEGARMVDEWPIIERRIRSDRLVFERSEVTRGLDLEAASLIDPDVDFRFVFDGGGGAASGGRREVRLTPDEQKVLALVDGRASVAELAERSDLGEFDTYRTLSDLATRDLIHEAKEARPRLELGLAGRGRRERWIDALLLLPLGAVALGSFATLAANPFTPWHRTNSAADRLRGHATRVRIERIERALQVAYLDRGTFVDRLEDLAQAGYVRTQDLTDPWGRALGYRRSAGGYQLQAQDESGVPLSGLSVARRFSAAQRMVLDPEPFPEPPDRP